MSCIIYFRMYHGRQSEQINFEGPGMKLIDLKRIIVERKNIGGGLDFDLKIVDENDSEKVNKMILMCLVYCVFVRVCILTVVHLFWRIKTNENMKFYWKSSFKGLLYSAKGFAFSRLAYLS